MSIAEKLTTIAENVPNVYKAGQDSQQSTIDNLQNQLDIANNLNSSLQKAWQIYHDEINEIRDEIRNLNVDVSYEIEPLSDAIPEVFEAGKKSQYDEFWDNFQDYGKRTGYVNGFSGFCWTKETFKPKYKPITFSGDCWYKSRKMFENFGVREYNKLETDGVDLTPDIVDFSNSNNLNNAFYGATFRSVTVDMSNATSFGGMFGGNDGGSVKYITLTTSDKTAAFSSNVFSYQTYLIELIFTEGSVVKGTLDLRHSTGLTKRSITSIINALSSTTSGTTVTFSKTAVNNAFGINVDDASTYPEGSEFYILRNSKSNWTFSYA
jgi:hypothetical protein